MVEPHWHMCEWCGCTFSHDKRLIAAGCGFLVHLCPKCGKDVNVRCEFADLFSVSIDFPDYYGAGNYRKAGGVHHAGG